MSITKEEIDDLDDLDDLLDDFDESSLPQASDVSTTAVPVDDVSKLTDKNSLPTLGNDDFARQLQSGMEDLMKELDTSPEARADFEQLMAQMNNATIDPSAAKSTSYPNNPAKASAGAIKTPKNFQESIEANLQRMRESESQAKDAVTEDSEGDAFMAEMMKQFQDSAGGDGDFGKVLEGMMSQLMSKEILYEPLLELHSKYPEWIVNNPKDSKLDVYKQQADLVKQIIEKFEDREYRDEDAAKKEEVMELMSTMQELGSPPKEILGEELGMFDSNGAGDCSIM